MVADGSLFYRGLVKIVTEKTRVAVEDPESPEMGAYLARPVEPGNYPGVVVAFEMFGLTSYIREVTDRIASLGYVAIAPDFYHRADPDVELSADDEGRRRGFELVGSLTRAGVLADVRAAIGRVRGTATGKVGMVGCSAGGHIAYLAAAQLDLAATAVFYGGWLTNTDLQLGRPEPTVTLTPGITGRLLYLVGDQDHAVPAEQYEQIAQQLADASVRHEMVVYPDTPHGFFCHQRETFREKPAEDAWRRVRDLLAVELS